MLSEVGTDRPYLLPGVRKFGPKHVKAIAAFVGTRSDTQVGSVSLSVSVAVAVSVSVSASVAVSVSVSVAVS
eukprot:2112023-Rhodomonas_salina.2